MTTEAALVQRRFVVSGLVIAAAVAAAVVAWRGCDRGARTATEADHVAARAAGGAPDEPATTPAHVGAADAAAGPVTTVRRLDRAQMQTLRAQLARARARARGQPAASAPPALPADDRIPLEELGPEVADALRAAIPILAECYPRVGSDAPRTAAVQMTMVSDPELGMVIDTTELHDPDGQPLPRALDDCLRDTIESLALPPLDRAGHVELQYSFRFED